MLYFMQHYDAVFCLNIISKQQINNTLAMGFDLFVLAPGEVSADRYDPADVADQTPPQATAADVAAWEANPWF